jgi:hypothetical protein
VLIAEAKVNSTVEPTTVAEVTAIGVPAEVTTKSVVAAVVALSVLSKLKTILVVVGAVTPVRFGAKAKSIVELFVIAIEFSEIPSLPATSCTARLEVSDDDVGAAYETVAEAPAAIGDAKVRVTVEPLTVTSVTERVETPEVTVNALGSAVWALSASLYVNVILRPVESKTAVPAV